MSRAILRSATLVGLLILHVVKAEAGGNWLTRLDEAKRLAATSGKDLFILFTGTEWCAACTDFERAVLSQSEFVRRAEPFILVKLEFPSSDEGLPPERQKDYIAWRERYGIRVFPTVLLTDVSGRPYAVTGHIGLAAGDYIRHLGTLRQAHDHRDAALSKAMNAQGIEKARHLDVALSAVREAFDKSYTELQGDMLVRFYHLEIDQILALDPTNAVALRDKYRDLLDADTEWDRVAEIYARFATAMKEEGANAALKLVDRELKRARSDELRKRSRRTRLFYLEWGDRNEEALACATDLAKDDSNSPEEKRRIETRVAFNLKRLGRINEALAIYDRLIVEVSGNRKAEWSYLRDKAHMLADAGRLVEALEAWETSRRFVEPGTESWLDTEIFRSRLLGRLGRLTEAIAGFDSALNLKSLTPLDRAILLVEKVLVLSKAGRHKEALAIADRAEKVLEAIESERADESATTNLRKALTTARVDAENKLKKKQTRKSGT